MKNILLLLVFLTSATDVSAMTVSVADQPHVTTSIFDHVLNFEADKPRHEYGSLCSKHCLERMLGSEGQAIGPWMTDQQHEHHGNHGHGGGHHHKPPGAVPLPPSLVLFASGLFTIILFAARSFGRAFFLLKRMIQCEL